MIKNVLTPFILLYLVGCSSTIKAPKWYLNPPEYKKGIRFSSGTATADDMQSAFDMARLAAESDLAKELKANLIGAMDRERQVLKSKTTLDRFQATVETIIDSDISGAALEKRDYTTKGNMYNAFVLLKYNENIMEKKLLSRLEAEKDLFEELKATEMLQDMRKRVKQYKESGY